VTIFFNAIIAGTTIGAIYAIVGIGFTVVFNATRVFNLAQGDLVMVGIMMSFVGLVVFKLNHLLTAALVIVSVVAIAALEERVVVRPFLRKQGAASFGWFIATLGFSLLVQAIVAVSFGNHPIVAIPSPFSLGGFQIGDVTLGYRQVFVIVTFLVVIGLLEVFYKRTWLGQAMRGTAQDREAASLLGISPATTSRSAFMLSGLVAAIAGFVIAPLTFSNPTVGLNFTLMGFLALAIGGFGSVRGAVVGGMLIGIGQQMWDLYLGSELDILTGLVLVLVVLSVRPAGLFNKVVVRNV
jgi:branched-chain amino acid transport system permease protein